MAPLRLGVATSAFQIEGASAIDGRGPSIWDDFCAQPGRILDGSNGSTACDSYARTGDDIALLRELGVAGYRFSIAWPRIQPFGTGAANQAGLDHYSRFVDELLSAGITPMVTLYHWDLPAPLEQAGGWPARDTAHRFADYAELVATRLGDRVEQWITHNEPWCAAFLGYAAGVFAPGRTDPADAFRAAHHLLLSHALAAERVRAVASGASVGLALNLTPVHAADGADPEAVRVVDGIQNGLWLDPLLDGRYPDLPHLAQAVPDPADDLAFVHGSADWLGINYYTPFRVGVPLPERAGVGQEVDAYPGAPPFSFHPTPPLTRMGWEVDPEGLAQVLRRVAEQAPGLTLRVTENGAAFPDVRDAQGAVLDRDRIDYLAGHLSVVERVRVEGVPVTDYLAWSLLDNFEWAQGYTQTFGLVSVEPGTLRRVPKASFAWYAEQVRSRR